MAGQTIQVSVLADTKKFSRAMKNLGKETGFTKLADGAKKAGKAIALTSAALGAVAAVGVKKAINAASDLNESLNAVNVTFGENAEGIKQLGREAASALGLSNAEFNSLAVQFSSFADKIAGPGGDVVGVMDEMTTRASDFASVMNLDVADAAAAFQSGLAGETEPLKKFGIDLSAAAVEAYALANGITDGSGAMTESEKVQARYGALMEQTAKTQGDFANTSGEYANAQRIMKANFENISASLGSRFLPMMGELVAWVNDKVLPAFEEFADKGLDWASEKVKELGDWFQTWLLPKLKTFWAFLQANVIPVLVAMGQWITGTLVPALQSFGEWVVKNKDWLLSLALTVGIIVAGIKIYTTTLAIWKAAVTAAKAAQIALNVAMSANPIGLIVLAIAALVAGLVWFFTQTETGRELWDKFVAGLKAGWEGTKEAFKAGWEAVQKWLSKAWDFIKKVWSYSPIGIITSNWDKIKAAFKSGGESVMNWLRKAWDFIKKVWSYSPLGLVLNNWDKITGAFKTGGANVKKWLQSAWDFIKKVWSYSPIGIITSNWDKIVKLFKGLPGRLVSGLGNLWSKLTSPFRRAFNSIAGYWNRTVGRVSFSIPDWVPGVGGRGWSLPKIPMLAQGGIATRATLAMIGEGGESEAVLPLSKLDAMLNGGGGGRVYNITVNTGVGDPIAIGREVNSVLRAYERANGGRLA